MLKDVDPLTWKSVSSHPRVGGTATCSSNVDRLKAGPANIPEVIYWGTSQANYQYTDNTFTGKDSLYINPYIMTQSFKDNIDSSLTGGQYFFRRWEQQLTTTSIKRSNNQPNINDVNQGAVGNCYYMAGMAALATNPTIWNDNVLTKEKNAAGIYGFKFYIRGKPWVVSVDSSLLFQNQNAPDLVFAQLDKEKKTIWSQLYEKAWAKVKGSFD